MGRAAIRSAAATYFANLQVPYVGAVYPARTYISESDYELRMLNNATTVITSDNGSGAVLVVNLPNSFRKREAMTGRGAVFDFDQHRIALEVFFASTGGDPVLAQEDNDTVMDAIVVGIRADPFLGNSATVWSAGEFDAGIRVTQGAPFTSEDGTTVNITGLVEFTAWENIAGEVPR